MALVHDLTDWMRTRGGERPRPQPTADDGSAERPRDPGHYGRFALGALLLAVVLEAVDAGVLALVALVLAVIWGVVWTVRVSRVVRWTKARGLS